MAVESPGWANQAGSYSAEQTRRAVFAAYARTGANSPGIIAGGLLSTADLQLTAPGSGMSVNVSTGEAIIGGSEGGAQGGYYARATSTTSLSIAAANATNPRIDTVCATISDAGYTEPTGGSGNQWALQVVTGTATATASLANLLGAATLPLSSLLLGYVLVPATATNIITADIANVAAPVLIQSRIIGASWIAPSLINSWTNFGSGFETVAYLKDPFGFVHLKGALSTSGATTATTAFVLPAGFRPGAETLHPAQTSTLNGALEVNTNGNVQPIFTATATSVGISGVTFLAEN